jgi:mannose-6-phosphate isomerase-like protein (cupin superfamily)
MKKGHTVNLEEATVENVDFRRVLYTGAHLQLVLMSLPPGGEIGEEVHETHDQFFRVDEGEGEVVIDDVATPIADGWSAIVPAGARHNVRNVGAGDLKLYTIYAPPEHRDGTIRATREEALASEEHFDGKTTE